MNCTMNGHYHKYFYVDIAIYNYMSQCRGRPWYQVQSKTAGNTILLIWENWFWFYQRQQPEVSYKKRVLKDFAIFTGKYLCQRLFLSYNFNKKETLAQGFFCELCIFFFNNTLFTEPLWMTDSVIQPQS